MSGESQQEEPDGQLPQHDNRRGLIIMLIVFFGLIVLLVVSQMAMRG